MRVRVRSAYFLSLLFLISFKLQASPVDSVTAKAVASGFYAQMYGASNTSLSLAYTETSANGTADYYIFNAGNNSGFVIISGDDAAHPVIGYSNTGHYRTGAQPAHIAYWFGRYKKKVENIILHNLIATSDIQNEWTAYKNNTPIYQNERVNGAGVAPLVYATWAQAPYFNDNCPDTCVAGCVATAMGQIMKYWSFPPHGIGAANDTDFPYGNLRANLDTTKYDWAAMPDNILTTNHQVSVLMYDLGVSVAMAYTPESSGSYMITQDNPHGASSQTAFVQNFGYNGGTIQGLYESDYLYNTWVSTLENELNNGRPIQYSGSGTDGGHSWVCDGYNGIGDFHMNWGWGGYMDGYYNISSLNPANTPLSEGEEALIGIEPNKVVSDFKANTTIIRAGDTVHFIDNSFGTTPVTGWQWLLPGASVSSTNIQNPVVTYGTPGTYNATETVTTSRGSVTNPQYDYIVVLPNEPVNVFPTVNNGNFTIQLHDYGQVSNNIQFSLYTLLGQKMYTTTLTQFTTQVSVELPHGLYFYRAFDSGNDIATGKLIMK